MASGDFGRMERIGFIVGGVIRQAVRDAGARGVAVLDDASPEARLALAWSVAALGADAVITVPVPDSAAVDGFRALGLAPPDVPRDRLVAELHRAAGRLVAADRDALLAHPANKTALLLGTAPPPEALLPLGDLYASQVAELAGGWTVPDAVRRLADRVGGIDRLDTALVRWAEERRPAAEAFAPLGDATDDLMAALEAARFARRRLGVIPKLGTRTLGFDLFG